MCIIVVMINNNTQSHLIKNNVIQFVLVQFADRMPKSRVWQRHVRLDFVCIVQNGNIEQALNATSSQTQSDEEDVRAQARSGGTRSHAISRNSRDLQQTHDICVNWRHCVITRIYEYSGRKVIFWSLWECLVQISGVRVSHSVRSLYYLTPAHQPFGAATPDALNTFKQYIFRQLRTYSATALIIVKIRILSSVFPLELHRVKCLKMLVSSYIMQKTSFWELGIYWSHLDYVESPSINNLNGGESTL